MGFIKQKRIVGYKTLYFSETPDENKDFSRIIGRFSQQFPLLPGVYNKMQIKRNGNKYRALDHTTHVDRRIRSLE